MLGKPQCLAATTTSRSNKVIRENMFFEEKLLLCYEMKI